ncbi:DUF423 domain-containing protein [Candidatus Albibeggiatoa sp. nov. BB20]|uniref:DUF423 domain-containing protein n=1 Tax=Candidatus Albibeggiatoa sp. nov. BB20 TaxID=3162723 RepID=UPI00336535E3
MMSQTFIILGSLNAFLAVALGAFGAHGLKPILSESLMAIYQTGVQYHSMHALGLIGIGILAQKAQNSLFLKLSGWLLLAGIILFCGSLYALAMTEIRKLGIITPFGGISFLLGWLSLTVAAYRDC